MNVSLAAPVLALTLLGCSVAVDERRHMVDTPIPPEVVPVIRERVAAARRIHEIRQEAVAQMRTLTDSGRALPTDLSEYEVAELEARLLVLALEQELVLAEAAQR